MPFENILSSAAWYNDLERRLQPNNFADLARITEKLNSYANPMQQLADFAKARSTPNTFDWAKSFSALSPNLVETFTRFNDIGRFVALPTRLAALSLHSFIDTNFKRFDVIAEIESKIGPAMNLFASIAIPNKDIMSWNSYLERSMGSISSMLAAHIPDEDNSDFIDRLSEVSASTVALTEAATEQVVSAEVFTETVQKIYAEIQALKLAAQQGKESFLKIVERVENHISFILGVVGIYLTMNTIPKLEEKISNQGQVITAQDQVIGAQRDSIRNLQQMIYRAIPKHSWVTNRKCPVFFKPMSKGIAVDSIDRLTSVDVVSRNKKWVQVSYYSEQDTFVKVGWVDKGYLDTIKNFKRAGKRNDALSALTK
jgi:hypothetical protein